MLSCAVVVPPMQGLNVIDSAPNYRNGRGELAIAQGLTMLRDNVKLGFRRDMLFFSTKAGYCTPSLLAQLLNKKLIKDTDVVDGHCIHPACLKASIKGSLERLNIRTVSSSRFLRLAIFLLFFPFSSLPPFSPPFFLGGGGVC
jgi:hypothetical protein